LYTCVFVVCICNSGFTIFARFVCVYSNRATVGVYMNVSELYNQRYCFVLYWWYW